MRQFLTVLALLPGVVGVLTAAADTIVLRDGRTLQSAGPYMVKGRQALIKQPDGTLVSIPLTEIDVDKTAAERQKGEAPAPIPTPSVRKPLTPAEAAKQKSGRKAALVLTDDEVAQSIGSSESEKKEEIEERVDIANANASKVKGGYAVTGSVVNSGKSDVSGVSVTIEAIGEANKTIASTFGQIAKDTLAPGEKSAFTANLTTDKDATNFRYVLRWQIRMGVKSAAPGSASGSAGDTSGTPPPTPGATTDQTAPKAEKAPEAAPTPVPISRPDVAPRSPNAAVGAPTQPGGTFLPKPTGDQPKPPGGN